MTSKGCVIANKRQKGFTFLELVITIFIVALLSIGFFSGLNTGALDANSEAQRLASELRYTQLLAMSKETPYRVNFSSSQYTLTDVNDVAITHAGLRGNNTINLAPGFTLTTLNLPNNYVVFGTNGEPYTNSLTPGTPLNTNATITISGHDQTATITITPQTGMVSLPN